MNPKLSKQQIMQVLQRLNKLLCEKGINGELCIFVGAAMVLAFDARESTRDVDAILVPKSEVLKCALQVSEEMRLRFDWPNDGVKGFISNHGEVTTEGMPVFSNLRIMRPTTEYLLAMKCLASRVADETTGGDTNDVITLIKHLGIKSSDEVCDIIIKYYKETLLPPKVRFFVEEIFSEL